jgi:hypothetical protein
MAKSEGNSATGRLSFSLVAILIVGPCIRLPYTPCSSIGSRLGLLIRIIIILLRLNMFPPCVYNFCSQYLL